MEAKALVCSEQMDFSLERVVLPAVGENEVRVKTAYSGVSIGTEFALIRNKISWGPYPISTGYMATGIVEEAGDAVEGIKPGDRVYVRANGEIKMADGAPVSSVCGTHASHIVSPVGGTHGAAVLPEGASMETASMFVMPAVGYKGVDMAQPALGDDVVVFGCGLIGLGVVAAASLRGCRIIAIDIADRQLEMARVFGADITINSSDQDAAEALAAVCADGADVVFECTGVPALVDQALSLCRTDGKFVWQGNYGSAPISISFLEPHNKRLQTFFPCDDGYGPCRRTVIKHMTQGILPWEKTVTHRIKAAEAPAMFERINKGDKDVVGVTIDWS